MSQMHGNILKKNLAVLIMGGDINIEIPEEINDISALLRCRIAGILSTFDRLVEKNEALTLVQRQKPARVFLPKNYTLWHLIKLLSRERRCTT